MIRTIPHMKKLFVRKGQNKETEQVPLQKSCSVSVYEASFYQIISNPKF